MNHTPWTQEQAEKWAKEKFVSLAMREAFLAGMAKAAEIVEESKTVYNNERYDGWYPHRNNYCGENLDTHIAKLVGVRPIEGEK